MRYIRPPPVVHRGRIQVSLRADPAHRDRRIVINLSADAIAITNHQGSQRISRDAVYGPYTRQFDIDARENTAIVGVHFKPGGIRAVLGVSPHELLGSHINLDAVWNGAAADLHSETCEAE